MKCKRTPLTVILIFSVLLLFAQDRSDWFEFYLPWSDSSKTVTDMSAYLDPPAGKHGFLQVTSDGHFKFENKNETERFVGVVNVAIANYPGKNEAKILAARMAKFGINLVRIHLIDVEGNNGLFQNSANNTLQISTDRLDKMDYFIKCLKDKGIYFNFCIHAGRIYKNNDGIDSQVENQQSKYVTLFNQKIIDLQKDFSKKIIGHTNPYTGLSYADDPAMANLELTNENSMFNGWMGWNSDYIFGDVNGGIGEYYSKELDSLFNNWLKSKYDNDKKLADAWSGNEDGQSFELIKNGSFEQDFAYWNKLVTGGASATITAVNSAAKHGTKSAKIEVKTPGTQNWHIQLKSNNFQVKKNHSYKIAFYAKGDVEKEVQLEVMENQTWKWILGPKYITASEWKYYEFYFNPQFDSNALIIAFNWGQQTGTFWIDSVSVSESFGTGLEQGESLAKNNISRTKNSQIGKYTKQRIGDNAEFYFDIEKLYTEQLTSYLKNDVDVKCPVTFTNNYYALADLYAQSQADYIDFHMYWDHPHFPDGWSNTNFFLKNKSILLSPESSTINKIPLTRVKNMPHVLSEYNHAYPYIFQTEAPSLLYAYGSFFDLDGIMWHAYYDFMNRYGQRHQDMFFDIAMHPVMMTQMLLALPYRMKTIKKAKNIVEAQYKRQDVFNNTKTYKNSSVINLENAEYGTSFLKHGFQHTGFESDTSSLSEPFNTPGNVITSDTEELIWDGNQGIFKVNSPFWQGATGYLGSKNVDLKNISISDVTTTDNLDFASIHLISLDSLPIGQSKRMILLISARLENEGLQWNADKTSLLAAGGKKALCEPVRARIKFKYSSSDSVSVYILDETGLRKDSLIINQENSDATFELNKTTLWYEINNHISKPVSSHGSILNPNEYMKIYPNPGKNHSTIEYLFTEKSKADLLVFNNLGKIIIKEPVEIEGKNNQTKILDISSLSDGIYFYGFQFSSGKRVLDKLIVRNQK